MKILILPMLPLGSDGVLAGRLSGQRAFVASLEKLPLWAEPTLVLLDFSDVSLATSSYLNALLVPLRDHLRLRPQPGYAVAANFNDKVREEVEEMLRRSGDAFLTCTTDAAGRPDQRRPALRRARRQVA